METLIEDAFMAELQDHEARRIRDYVNSQPRADDQAGLVQRVGSLRIMGRVHEMYDVHCPRSRWWVITEPTNLYTQEDFPEVEQALIFNLDHLSADWLGEIRDPPKVSDFKGWGGIFAERLAKGRVRAPGRESGTSVRGI